MGRVVAAALLSAASGLACAQIPALEEVPAFLPADAHAPLEARHSQLAMRRDRLRTRIRDHDGRCRVYASHSPEAATCPPAKEVLHRDRDAYVANVKAFNWDLEQAIGDYRISLEKGLARAEEALRKDAEAMKRLGFERRAEDFMQWLDLSDEARRKLSKELTKFIVDAGGQAVVKGFAETLHTRMSELDPGEARAWVLKLEQAGLGRSPSAQRLRALGEAPARSELNDIAALLHKDLQTLLNAREEAGLERFLEMLKLFGGEAVEKSLPGLAIGELAVWSTWSASAQAVAAMEVSRLNTLTGEQLKGLAAIRCVTERHMVERHRWLVRMAEFRGESAPRAPARSASCR